MSASAPLGSPRMNTGSVDADCTSATHSGEGASDVISHAAATSFIHIEVLAANQVSHSIRNTGLLRGPKVVASGATGGGSSVACSDIRGRESSSSIAPLEHHAVVL